MKQKLSVALTLILILTAVSTVMAAGVHAQTETSTLDGPVHVQTGVWIINVQKIDLAASTYRLDFYLWFTFNPKQINVSEVSQFEFVNGEPSIKQIDANDS